MTIESKIYRWYYINISVNDVSSDRSQVDSGSHIIAPSLLTEVDTTQKVSSKIDNVTLDLKES